VNDENSNITNTHVEKIISSPSTTTLPLQQEEVMTPTLPSSSSISMAKYRQIESDLFKHIKEFKNSYINDKDVLNSLEEKLKVQKEALETQQNLLKQQDILKQELITNLNKANRKINELETSSNNVDEAVLKLRKELSGANDRYGRKDVLYKELNEKYKMLEQKLTEKQNTVVHLTNKSYKDEEKIKMLNAKLDISTESTKEIVSNTANIEHELEKYKRLHEEMKEKFIKKDEECGMYETKSQTLQKEMDGMTKAFQLKENEIISGFNMKLNTKKKRSTKFTNTNWKSNGKS
jgi:chromosome segregation ATPase